MQLKTPEAQAFFYRTHAGAEVDLIIEKMGRLIPIEIKLGVSPPNLLSLESFMKEFGCKTGYVVNRTTQSIQIKRGIWMMGLGDFIAAIFGV